MKESKQFLYNLNMTFVPFVVLLIRIFFHVLTTIDNLFSSILEPFCNRCHLKEYIYVFSLYYFFLLPECCNIEYFTITASAVVKIYEKYPL